MVERITTDVSKINEYLGHPILSLGEEQVWWWYGGTVVWYHHTNK